MTKAGHNSVDPKKLRGFVARIERLDEEIAALNADKREVYGEAKEGQLDVKALKAVIGLRRKDRDKPGERTVHESVVDEYMAILDKPSRVHAHAREETRPELPSFAPGRPMETGSAADRPDSAEVSPLEPPGAQEEDPGHAVADDETHHSPGVGHDPAPRSNDGTLEGPGGEEGVTAAEAYDPPGPDDDLLDIPPFLRRQPGETGADALARVKAEEDELAKAFGVSE